MDFQNQYGEKFVYMPMTYRSHSACHWSRSGIRIGACSFRSPGYMFHRSDNPRHRRNSTKTECIEVRVVCMRSDSSFFLGAYLIGRINMTSYRELNHIINEYEWSVIDRNIKWGYVIFTQGKAPGHLVRRCMSADWKCNQVLSLCNPFIGKNSSSSRQQEKITRNRLENLKIKQKWHTFIPKKTLCRKIRRKRSVATAKVAKDLEIDFLRY